MGGGAAGMLAAWRAALRGGPVLLLEATPRLGSKIRISGGGKCNVTHDGSLRELLAAFPRDQARFLRPAFQAFGNGELRDLLRRQGVETWVRGDGRVFPEGGPGSAGRVVEALRQLLEAAGVQVALEARVQALRCEGKRLLGLQVSGRFQPVEECILATGGASYPRIGTQGECLGWFAAMGLPVRPWFPALAPVPLQRPRPEWEGVAFRGGELQLRSGAESAILDRKPGDLVFTREGVSGPAALELSQSVEAARRAGGAWLTYAFAATGDGALESELLDQCRRTPGSALRGWLGSWLPERVAAAVLTAAGIPGDRKLKELSRRERKAALALVGAFPLGEPRPVPLDRGEVVAGGLDLGAVDPHTLRPRGWMNLKVCGESLDLNGPIGGYNLQAAFSTGFLAGENP